MTANRKTTVSKTRSLKSRATDARVKAKVAKARASKPRASKRTANAILQFAPNFTAYVLPPATVCLYSEHRKFFLHGELYCAIAEAIGKKGKETQALVAELSRKFPVEQIQETLRRLYERRYVTLASPVTTGPVAGFWASIGLPPED